MGHWLAILSICSFCLLGVQLSASQEVETAQGALVVVLLGPPGSGKGTQAVKLSQRLGLPHISTGDLFRENIKLQTELGKQASAYISQGQLVPDELTLNLLFDRVAQADCAQGFLLDGFPRTRAQAEALDLRLPENTEMVVVNLDVADQVIVKRAVGRLLCKSCGHIQHKEFSPPKRPGICDQCGGELYQRTDDTEPVVKERLRVYHNQTKPVVDYYDERGFLESVNGEQSPDEVFDDLFSVIMGD